MPERGRVSPRARGPARCVYCHDDVGADEAVECPECGTLLHPDCAPNVKRCPTVGCAGRLPDMDRGMDRGASLPVFALNHLGRSRLALALTVTWFLLGFVVVNVASVHLSTAPREHILDAAPEGSPRSSIEREVPRWPPLEVAWYALGGAAAAAALQAALTWSAWRREDPASTTATS